MSKTLKFVAIAALVKFIIMVALIFVLGGVGMAMATEEEESVYESSGIVKFKGGAIIISSPSQSVANEGLGNGVDGNTPGHAHNGGNDDPQFTPGNPGAANQ